MKKGLLSLVLLMFVSFVFSQEVKEENTIVGAWVFSELSADSRKGMDEKQLIMMNSMFSEIKLDLKEDGTYFFNDGRMEENGTYEYDAKKKVLSFVPSTKLKYSDDVKKPYKTEIGIFTQKQLEIKKNSFGMVLKR